MIVFWIIISIFLFFGLVFMIVFFDNKRLKKLFKNERYDEIIESYKASKTINNFFYPNIIAESYFELGDFQNSIFIYEKQLKEINDGYGSLKQKIKTRLSNIKILFQESKKIEITSNLNFLAFDFETANREPSSVCALGIAYFENSQLVFSKEWKIKPTPNYFLKEFTEIHGFSKESNNDSPTFDLIWHEIKPYFENKLLVAHNVSFDINCLSAVLSAYNLENINYKYVCTLSNSRKNLALNSYNLPSVSSYFNIPLNHHNAESDAIACGTILIGLAELSKIKTNDDLEAQFSVNEQYAFTPKNIILSVSFSETKSKVYQDALIFLRKQDSYEEAINSEGKTVYSADFSLLDKTRLDTILDMTKNWKNRVLKVDDKEIKRADLSTALWLLSLPPKERKEDIIREKYNANINFLINHLQDKIS